MTRKIASLTGLAALAAAAAFATVTFNPTTGLGFVGKGDVQRVFGWNNAAAQNNIPFITFTYNDVATYSAVCQWETGQPGSPYCADVDGHGPCRRIHQVSIPRHTKVNTQVAYDARTHKQIDGIFLTGFGQTTTEGTVPVVGGTCVGGGESEGNGQDGTWVSVTLVSSSGGGLTVTYNNLTFPIWP